MNRPLLFILICLCPLLAWGQTYVVTSITGHVVLTSPSGQKTEVQLRQRLSADSRLSIAYKSGLELLDESLRRQYRIATPGNATLGELLRQKGNTVMQLTGQYAQYMTKRLRGDGTLTSRRHSDPATVTREVAEHEDDFEAEFLAFSRQSEAEFEAFRRQALAEFLQFVNQAWASFEQQSPTERPKDPERPPLRVPEGQALQPVKGLRLAVDDAVLRLPERRPQPSPIAPVREQKAEDQPREYVDLTLYGTPLRVRFSEVSPLTLDSLTPQTIARAWEQLSAPAYDNTLFDCLDLRQRHQLSDWAYLKLLDAVAHACYATPKEATLLQAYLYQQSGYKMRLGMTDDELCLLYASDHHIYGQPYFTVEGQAFYPYGCKARRLSICAAAYRGERPLSLLITAPQMLAVDLSAERQLSASRYPAMSITTQVNKNLLAFYDDYPQSSINQNIMTRWAIYAQTPLEASLEAQLLPQFRQQLASLGERQKVERLLNWVQTAFEYELDDKVWGYDRPFFAEETLYYPYCDCEDRSILLSRLVRELAGLPVILVYYPGHLATAVAFNEDVQGDYIELGGRRYVVCDPTYIGAPVGLAMPDMSREQAKVILLE